MSQLQPKAVLRLLLRAVDRHITSVAGNQQWRQHVLAQFRQAQAADAAQQQRLLLIAQEYADLVRNIAHHQELLETYNIGTDPDARNKHMVEKTAARVGFKLPGTAHATGSSAAVAMPTDVQQQQQQQVQGQGQHSQQQQQQEDAETLQQRVRGASQQVDAVSGGSSSSSSSSSSGGGDGGSSEQGLPSGLARQPHTCAAV